ncbi:unnamed protein product, partial [Ectocarpus fasciculatus]
SSSGSGVVEEEMEPEPYPPNLERGVKVRKRSMAGKSEIRSLYVRGDTIELVNPEKRMFRSQSKVFPLSELTAVVAQGERSLSLSLGAKGLHLTLADRATKEYLWEHLRKMREQAREQAKASRITRAASIDMIGSGSQDFKRPKGGRKSVQFQVPENEGLDSDTTDSPLPEFLSNPDVRFEVTPGDRAALRAALEQLRDALKRATISSESSFTISRSAPGLMPTANAVALAGMRMSRMSASSPSGGTVSGGGVVTGGGGGGGAGAGVVIGGGADGGAGAGDQGRLGKQYGSGLPSLLACLKGLKRAGTRLSERHFFCYVGGFTELVSTAEKAWVAISKRSPPDVAAVDRVKAAIIEGTHLAEDHGGGTGDVPHSGARLVVRMVRGLLESDGERLK